MMSANQHAPIPLWQANEHAPLQAVVMCLANPFDADPAALAREAAADPVLQHQAAHNRFRPYDVALVHHEQTQFIAALRTRGIEVLMAEPIGDCISQHYPRDIGFVIDDLFVCARPRRPYRQRELAGLRALLPRLPRVLTLDAGCIEGGDVFVHGDEVIVGLGEETDQAGVAALAQALEVAGNPRTVTALPLAERGVIHTDTKFNIIGPQLAICHPPAFAPASLAWLESRFDLIPATAEETLALEINTLVIGEAEVVMSSSGRRLAEAVARRGLCPVLIDYDEVNALPGSFRCTTLPLRRAGKS